MDELTRLAKRLSELLDEDQWAECETLLLVIATKLKGVPINKRKIATKQLRVFKNRCRYSDSLGIDYHWCGHGAGGDPNLELYFNKHTGDLVGCKFVGETE